MSPELSREILLNVISPRPLGSIARVGLLRGDPGEAAPMPGKRAEEEADRDAKRARPVLITERFMSDAPTVVQSLSDLVSKLGSDSDESAIELCDAARKLQSGNRDDIRSLCSGFGVRLTKPETKAKRKNLELMADLTLVVIEKATEYLTAAACRDPQPGSESIATELASDDFCFEEVTAEALRRIRDIRPAARILARIVERW